MNNKVFLCAVILLFISCTAFSQKTVQGLVKDASGEVLISATVQSPDNPLQGTTTDLNGLFSFTVPDATSSLLISFTGYTTEIVPLKDGQTYVEVILNTAFSALDEVVIVGYGSMRRSQLTGTVAEINSDEIEDVQVVSLESAMQGRMAGVVVTSGNGKLGQGISLRIRGSASINASNEPLYVVDGVVLTSSRRTYTAFNAGVNPLADINMADIESISVLKDAAATAIYGARGSNGVVLITTKRGKANESQINLDISTGFSEPTRKREWLNAKQYLELWEEAFNNVANADGLVSGVPSSWWKNTFIPGWDGGYDTNWEDLSYNEESPLQEMQVSASGGDDKTRYYIAGSYLDQTGIMYGNEFNRISGRINLEHQSSKNYDLGVNLSLSQTNNVRVPQDGDFSAPTSISALPPVQPLRDPDDPDEYFERTVYLNAYRTTQDSDWNTRVFSNLGNIYLNWRPIKNLSIRHDFGLDHKTQDEKLYIGSRGSLPIFGEPRGYAYSTFRTTSNYTTNHYATYQRTSSGLSYDATLGSTFQKLYQHYNRVSGRQFPNDDFRLIANAAETFEGVETEWKIANLSYFLRFNMDGYGKYLFSFSSRVDGDSRFGPDNRFGFFPAVSAGWIASKEPFLADIQALSHLKLRASWGITGNVPAGDYPYQGGFGFASYAGRTGIRPTQVPNPGLRWEKTSQINLGLDFGLWEDRISGQLDVYRKNTEDLLLQVSIPRTSGFASQLQNLGSLYNEGLELSLSAYIFDGSFSWKSSFNAAVNRNEVTDIRGEVIFGGFINRAVEGQPIGVFFGAEYAGVDPDNGDALYYLNDELENGERNRETTNNFNFAERVVIGDPNPDLTYGFSNSFSYQGITLDVFFQGQLGNEVLNGAGIYQLDGFGWFDNQDIRILDRWQNPGDVTDIPQLRFLQPMPNSSRFIEPGSYLRLKTLTLAYRLPKSILSALRLSRLQLYFTGQNLLTFTKYQGWDPEVNADFQSGNLGLGTDFYTPPQARTLVFGIKAGF